MFDPPPPRGEAENSLDAIWSDLPVEEPPPAEPNPIATDEGAAAAEATDPFDDADAPSEAGPDRAGSDETDRAASDARAVDEAAPEAGTAGDMAPEAGTADETLLEAGTAEASVPEDATPVLDFADAADDEGTDPWSLPEPADLPGPIDPLPEAAGLATADRIVEGPTEESAPDDADPVEAEPWTASLSPEDEALLAGEPEEPVAETAADAPTADEDPLLDWAGDEREGEAPSEVWQADIADIPGLDNLDTALPARGRDAGSSPPQPPTDDRGSPETPELREAEPEIASPDSDDPDPAGRAPSAFDIGEPEDGEPDGGDPEDGGPESGDPDDNQPDGDGQATGDVPGDDRPDDTLSDRAEEEGGEDIDANTFWGEDDPRSADPILEWDAPPPADPSAPEPPTAPADDRGPGTVEDADPPMAAEGDRTASRPDTEDPADGGVTPVPQDAAAGDADDGTTDGDDPFAKWDLPGLGDFDAPDDPAERTVSISDPFSLDDGFLLDFGAEEGDDPLAPVGDDPFGPFDDAADGDTPGRAALDEDTTLPDGGSGGEDEGEKSPQADDAISWDDLDDPGPSEEPDDEKSSGRS